MGGGAIGYVISIALCGGFVLLTLIVTTVVYLWGKRKEKTGHEATGASKQVEMD